MIAGRTKERLKPLAQVVIRNTPGRRVRWGSLRRTKPLSEHFGWDRGLPVDRWYLEAFLDRCRDDIRGDVMEVRSPEYARIYGGDRVTAVEVVDIDAKNPKATIIADLCEADSLPPERFDSIVFTQTLHYLPDERTALANLWRSLRPGGRMLVTAPSIIRVDNETPEWDHWRYTPVGLRRLLTDSLPGEAEIEVEGHGNTLSAVAFLLGIAVQELHERELAEHHPAFPVLITARVLKPA